MSASIACKCPERSRLWWRVIDRRCNYSAFNGYRYTPSKYSCVRCIKCGGFWRTKARYVNQLRDATREEALRAV